MRVVQYESFDDPSLANAWAEASQRREPEVFATLGWQRAWWRAYGRGELILLGVESDGRVQAIAPLFMDGDMLFLVGSGGSDRLDIVGGVDDMAITMLLEAALDVAPSCVGMRFYHVPDESPTHAVLADAARGLRLDLVDEDVIVDPWLDLVADGDHAASKQSLVRHERGLRRDGELVLRDLRDGEAAAPWLDVFFDQHVERWEAAGIRSPFAADPRERTFFREVASEGGGEGWLRFLVLEWSGRAAAFHFGTRLGSTYLYYKPSFDIALARHSPGEVMLRQLILAAKKEGARWLDLGIGDEAYKRRFTSVVHEVRTVGLYPQESFA